MEWHKTYATLERVALDGVAARLGRLVFAVMLLIRVGVETTRRRPRPLGRATIGRIRLLVLHPEEETHHSTNVVAQQVPTM